MNTNEMIKVLAAHNNSETIEYYSARLGRWAVCNNPSWNFKDVKYRVKAVVDTEVDSDTDSDDE